MLAGETRAESAVARRAPKRRERNAAIVDEIYYESVSSHVDANKRTC
jgi:hypothetical protein